MKSKIFPLFIIILCLSFLSAKAQEKYYVTFIKGEVILKKTNKVLKIGDEIKENDLLKFNMEGDVIGAVSEKGKRVKLSLNKSQIERQKNKNEFVSVLSAFMPVRKMAALRALTKRVVLKDEFEMEYFFGAKRHDLGGFMMNPISENEDDESRYFLILDKGEYPIKAKDFPLNTKQYFYLAYTYEDITYKKDLAFEGRNLIIDTTIYIQDGKTLEKEKVKDMKLFYKYADGNSLFITEFRPFFPDKTELKTSLQSLIEKNKGNFQDTDLLFRNEILPYLSDYYGEPEPYNVRVWLEKELNFKVGVNE
jgi:hypothetical protein